MSPGEVALLALVVVAMAGMVGVGFAFWAGYRLGCKAGLEIAKLSVADLRRQHAAELELRDAVRGPVPRRGTT